MLRKRASAHANRAANAAYRSAGGPRAFTWLQCIGEGDERGADRLYLFVVSNADVTPAMLYQFATRRAPKAVAFETTPHSLQVAVTSFIAIVRALEPMVQIAAAAEANARRQALASAGHGLKVVSQGAAR